jgi:hypothetical protein
MRLDRGYQIFFSLLMDALGRKENNAMDTQRLK